MTIDLSLAQKDDGSRPSSSVMARGLFIQNCDSSTPLDPRVKSAYEGEYHPIFASSLGSEEFEREDECDSRISNNWPEFEDVLGLEKKLEEMSARKQKQFLFLHSTVNSSSDDSQLSFPEEETAGVLSQVQPADSQSYNFELSETPIPLPELPHDEDDPLEILLRTMLMSSQQVSYSVPLVLKHLICTDDNLMGFEEKITLERIVRRKILSDIIPMCSLGSRSFLPVEIDFSPTYIGQENVINITKFIRKLSDKFQPRNNSFFNTRFQLSYSFENGTFKIMYGIFEDHSYSTQNSWNSNYIDLHVFSRYLSKNCFFATELDESSTINTKLEVEEREWKSFMTMGDIFNLVDFLLKGKSSFIQSNSHLLKYIKNGGSLRSAAKKYELSVQKNKHRILSNVKKYIRGKRILSTDNVEYLGSNDGLDRDFHCGLFEQVKGYYSDLGHDDFQETDATYVIELKDFEDVIKSIAEKYVYEKYVHQAPSNTL